jgi:hypothetical protein
LFVGCLSISPIAAVNSALPPAPGLHAGFAREFGFNAMHGQLAGRYRSRQRHSSRPGRESSSQRRIHRFPQAPRWRHPANAAVKRVLDNHFQGRRTWLATQPAHRFEFTFTPKPGSWLNLIEGFFSKLAPLGLDAITWPEPDAQCYPIACFAPRTGLALDGIMKWTL